MKKLMLFAVLVCTSLFGFKASAQHNPTITIINNSGCYVDVTPSINGCPQTNQSLTPIRVSASTTLGPFDGTSVTWATSPAPNPASIIWCQFVVTNPCTSAVIGSGVCPGGNNVTSGSLCVMCSNAVPQQMVYASVSYNAAGDATVTIQ